MMERSPSRDYVGNDLSSSPEAGKNKERKTNQKEWLSGIGRKVLGLFRKSHEEPNLSRVEAIARKKGYYKDEEGEWYYPERQNDGPIHKCPVPGFELDEKYPEVAKKYEGAVERYFGKYKLSREYVYGPMYHILLEDRWNSYNKKKIVDNIDKFESMDSETWCDVSYLSFLTASYGEFNRLFEASKRSNESFREYVSSVPEKRRTVDEILNRAKEGGKGDFWDRRGGVTILETIERLYGSECRTDDFIEFVSSLDITDEQGDNSLYIASDGIEGVLRCGGSRYLGEYMRTLKNAKSVLGDSGEWVVLPLRRYVKRNGLNEDSSRGFSRVVEDVQDEREEVSGFGKDIARSREGEFGLETYIIECYTRKSEPANIDYLVRIHNEIPTTDFNKREQNRRDAILLERRLFDDRTFIHEERPGVHEVMSAIVDYYDGKSENRELFEERRKSLVNTISKYNAYGIDEEWLLECNYDSEIYDGGEKIIDVVRRLASNTEPVPLSVPKTRFPELNEALEEIEPILNEKTGEVRVGIGEVGEAVAILNRILLDGKGEQSLFPSTISAVAYLDKMSAYALRGISKKEWSELAFDDGFKEIVRFSELTSSTGYSDEDFERFFGSLRRRVSDAFEDQVDFGEVGEAYKELEKRITGNMERLGAKYASNPKTERFSSAIWSGNLAHELMGLFEKF